MSLDDLKNDVKNLSRLKNQVSASVAENKKVIEENNQIAETNEKEMMKILKSLSARNEIANANEREKIKNSLSALSHGQQVMNKQIINLYDKLTDTTALNAVYEARRDELEANYQEEKEITDKRLQAIKQRISAAEKELDKINAQIDEKNKELKTLNLRLIWNNFIYSTWIVPTVIIAILTLVIEHYLWPIIFK